jgi:hypothetical protein
MHSETLELLTITPDMYTPLREQWLVDCLIEALPQLKMRELFDRRRDMFTEADLITVAVAASTGKAVGALSSRWVTLDSGVPFLHITTQFVGERHRHGVVFRRSWAEHLRQVSAGPRGFPGISVLKTYNPKVYCAMSSFARIPAVSFYPSLVTTPGPAVAERRLAAEIAATISPGHRFDLSTGVIADAGVPADLYPELPRSTDETVNEYFARTVRPQDRLLCLLRVPSEAVEPVLRYFAAPRSVAPEHRASAAARRREAVGAAAGPAGRQASNHRKGQP